MLRLLPYVIEIGVLVFCLIDCIQTDSVVVRNLSKTLWVFIIILLPIVGGVAWLVAGRPQGSRTARAVPWPATATAGFPEYERPRSPRGPDDDPDFLADLRASDREHERMLADWERQLRDRESALQAADAGEGTAAEHAAAPGGDTVGEEPGADERP